MREAIYICDDCFWIGQSEEIVKDPDEHGYFVYIACPLCGGDVRNVSSKQYYDVSNWEEAEKTVSIYCAARAEGTFVEGGAISPYNLPISRDLAEKIRDWNWWHDIGYHPRINDFDPQDFTITGLYLAKQVKQEIPDWTVIFWDEIEWDGIYEVECETLVKQDYSHCITEIVLDETYFLKKAAGARENNLHTTMGIDHTESIFPIEVPMSRKGKILTEKDIILPRFDEE